MLDAQNRVTQADAGYYDAIVRYMIALKNIHFEKGTLLEYNSIAFVDRVRPTRPVVMPSGMSELPLTDYSTPVRSGQPKTAAVPVPLSSEEFIKSLPAAETLPSNAPLSQ